MSSSHFLDAVCMSMLAHKGQVRKDHNIPYWVHPSFVSAMVAEWGGSAEQYQAALIHDVVEDTKFNLIGIRSLLGDPVADIVAGLTEVRDANDTSWAVRKLKYMATFALNGDSLKQCYLPKLADIFCNTSSTLHQMCRVIGHTPSERTIVGYYTLAQVCLYQLFHLLPDDDKSQYRIANNRLASIFTAVSEMYCESREPGAGALTADALGPWCPLDITPIDRMTMYAGRSAGTASVWNDLLAQTSLSHSKDQQ